MTTKTKAANPIETAVAEYLAAQGVTFSATGGVATKRDDWDCDQWSISFTRAGNPTLLSEFFTGTGHRELTRAGLFEIQRAGKCSAIYLARLKAAHSKPVAPCAANALHSLLLEACSAEQNFIDWCDELGYDNDSLKARGVYDACSKTLQKIRAFFTGAERAALQKLLQDY